MLDSVSSIKCLMVAKQVSFLLAEPKLNFLNLILTLETRIALLIPTSLRGRSRLRRSIWMSSLRARLRTRNLVFSQKQNVKESRAFKKSILSKQRHYSYGNHKSSAQFIQMRQYILFFAPWAQSALRSIAMRLSPQQLNFLLTTRKGKIVF